MIIFVLLVASSSAVNVALNRLQNQMANILNGTEFEGFPGNSARNEIDFQTFKYGCHCRFDRSLQQMGRGEPFDAIDTACKVYKSCLKCVRNVFGNECYPESTTYTMQEVQGGYGVSEGQRCMDQIGTCERDICECDLAFVTAFVKNQIDYDLTKDHDVGFNFDSECVQRGKNTNSLGCCRSYSMETAFVVYRVDRQECCHDGTVASVGEC